MNVNELFIASFLLFIILAFILCFCHIIPLIIQNIRSRFKVKPVINDPNDKIIKKTKDKKNVDALKCNVVNPMQILVV